MLSGPAINDASGVKPVALAAGLKLSSTEKVCAGELVASKPASSSQARPPPARARKARFRGRFESVIIMPYQLNCVFCFHLVSHFAHRKAMRDSGAKGAK